MKKVFQKAISLLLVFALMNLQGFASVNVLSSLGNDVEINEFASFNESEFMAEFDELKNLEDFLELGDASYADVSEISENLVLNVNTASVLPFEAGTESGPALGIPSFLWGCVFGWVGLLVVYLITENKDETKKALTGCVVSGVVGIVIYVVVIAAAAASTSTVNY